MKKVSCPQCDCDIAFDEKRYSEGRSLFFICPSCGKKFSTRLAPAAEAETPDCGTVVVLENAYGYRQEFPLVPGANIIGRRNKGTDVQIAVETDDTTMERCHCVIDVTPDKQGSVRCTLRDFPSTSGTFYKHRLLNKRERVLLESGAVITLGSTTLIVYLPDEEDDEYEYTE